MTNTLVDRLEDIDPYDNPGAADVVMDDAKQEIERLRGALLWIASMADEDNEWDGVERFRTARQKAIDAVGPAHEPGVDPLAPTTRG